MNTPILKMLNKYRNNRMRFHVPSHKGALKCLNGAAKRDITELAFSDNLLSPHGVIKEAERLFAEAYGAERAFFCTCGATGAILSALSLFSGETVIVARDAHTSVFHALELFSVRPAFAGKSCWGDIEPAATLDDIVDALDRHPEAKAVFVTSPNYYGKILPLARIFEAVKKRGKLLLVDASHGSHFAFSPALPPNPAPSADLTVVSVHKTGLALTQGAAVLVNGHTLSCNYERRMKMLHTTSPSYLILATIDFSRAFMVQYYRKIVEVQMAALQELKRALGKTCFFVAETDDFTRLVVDVSALCSGYTAERRLNAAGIYPEFADFTRVVFIVSAADGPRKIGKLRRALVKLSATEKEKTPLFCFSGQAVFAEEYLTAYAGKSERVSAALSAGRIAKENIGWYPPAVPAVIRGERIPRELAEGLALHCENVFGLSGDEIEVLI